MAKTKEQKVADKLAVLVNDVTLDLDEIGRALVDQNATISYNRLVLIVEAAIQEKENENGRQFDTLF